MIKKKKKILFIYKIINLKKNYFNKCDVKGLIFFNIQIFFIQKTNLFKIFFLKIFINKNILKNRKKTINKIYLLKKKKIFFLFFTKKIILFYYEI